VRVFYPGTRGTLDTDCSKMEFLVLLFEKYSCSELIVQIKSLEDGIENDDRQKGVISDGCHKFNDTGS